MYWHLKTSTGFSSEIGTKLRELAVGQAGGSCGRRDYDITEIDITESDVAEFDITENDITESDITETNIT